MTSSRLKFELIDGLDSNLASPIAISDRAIGDRASSDREKYRRPSNMTTSEFESATNHSGAIDWSRRANSLRSSVVPSVFDPTLLHDLAEGLELLQRQLDDSESELEQSREISRAFELDARRWEGEATRLREESAQTRQALDQLRNDFEQSLEASREQQKIVDRLGSEVAEMRFERARLEVLAAEQQRALVLSVELLKRLNSGEAVIPSAFEDCKAPDQEIAELRHALDVEIAWRAETDKKLTEALSEVEARNAVLEGAQSEILALRAQLAAARAEAEATRSALAAASTDLAASKAELETVRAELAQVQDTLKRLSEQPSPSATDPQQIKQLEAEKGRLAQKLVDTEAEIALQNAEVESRGAIIVALENALEDQNTSLRTLEERFLAYAEQVQSIQLQRLEMPASGARSLASKFAKIFSPPNGRRKN